MSSFEFFPEERPLAIESEADALLPGDIDVPAFRGMGHEAWAAPARGMVRLGEAAGLAAGAVNAPIDSLLGTDLQDQAFGSADRMRAVRESMVLRPGEIGVAARVLGGLGEFVTQLAVARSPGALASTILGTSSDLAVAGVDPQTAVQAGTLEGAGLAVGLRIPTLGATLAQRVGLGAGANVAQGVITRGAVGELLRSEGAPAGVAEGYQAWDGEALIVDALAGAVFGGVDHWSARPDVAALNDHVHRVARTAPGVPQTADALDAHAQALDTALSQVLADEPVTVQAPPGRFVDDGKIAAAQAEVARVVESDARWVDWPEHWPRTLPDGAPQLIETVTLPDRQWVADRVFEHFLGEAQPAPDGKPVAIILGGGGGSGKGTVKKLLAKQGELPPHAVDIDPDEIKTEWIPEFAYLKAAGDSRAAAVVHDESSVIARELLRRAVEMRANLVLDRTLNNFEKGSREINSLIDAGYEVHLVGVALDTETAIERAEKRAVRSGRYVPVGAIREAHAGFARNFEGYASVAHTVRLFDNNDAEPFLAAAGARGTVEATNAEAYDRFRRKANETKPDRPGAVPAGDRGERSRGRAGGPEGPPEARGSEAAGASRPASPGAVDPAPSAPAARYTLEPSTPEDEGLAGWRPRRGHTSKVYAIKDGDRSIGFLDVSISPDGAAVVEDIVADRGRGALGFAGTRALLRALLTEHPEITTINGERVSGIRRGGRHGLAGSGVQVSVPIPQVERPTAAGADGAEVPNTLQGADGAAAVVITERGLEVPVRYRVVDAAALITSHNDALEADPRFPPELQPRDRTRAASDQQIAKIENAIRPELLGESVKASDGAPIVGADGVVESGNARTIALRRAYARNKAGIYREWLRANAARFGLDPAAVDGMAAPVLVRVAQGARDRAEFARQANESAIAAMSPGELARADAQRLGSLEGLATNEDGSINLAQSRAVVDAYLRDVVSPADLNTTTTADGGLSQFGLTRLRNAIFARAYGDTELLQALTESIDSNVKNVLAGMVRAAPEVARLRDLQAEGARHPIPVFDDFAQAVREFQAMRRDGISLAQREAQGGLFGDDLPAPVRNLIAGLEENSRAPKRMAELLSHMARTVDAAGDPRQGGLFGEVTAAPDAAEVSNAAVARIRREYEVKATADLFASPTMAAAIELAATRPDMTVINADGVEVPAAQALAEADAAIRQAEELAPGVDALAACALQQLATVA